MNSSSENGTVGGTIYWEALCGPDNPFWDPMLTINTTRPTLSRCFRDTALIWIPCAFLWLCLPLYLLYLRSLPSVNAYKNRTIQYWLTLMLIFLLLVVCSVKLVLDLSFLERNAATFSGTGLLAASFIISGALSRTEFKKDVHSHEVQCVFWLLLFLCELLNILSVGMDRKYHNIEMDPLYLSLCLVRFILTTLRFICTLFSDYPDKKKPSTRHDSNLTYELANIDWENEPKAKASPSERATMWSTITFSWILGMMWRGYKRSLEFEDLYDLPTYDKTEEVCPMYEGYWEKEQERKGDRRQRITRVRFMLILIRVAWIDMVKCVMYRLLNIVVEMTNPLLLGLFLNSLQDKTYKWHGYALAVLFFVFGSLFGVTGQYAALVQDRIGMRVRTAITAAIYKKSMRLSSRSRNRFSTGEIFNMVAVDIGMLQHMFWPLTEMFFMPIVMIVGWSLLLFYLGKAVIAGTVIVVVYLIFNFVLMSKYGDLQDEQMEKKDRRLRVFGDVLRAIKVLKLYAWDKLFGAKTTRIRKKELKYIRRQNVIKVIVDVISESAWCLCAIGTFVTYVLLGNTLTPHTVYVTLMLMDNITWSLEEITDFLETATEGIVSLRRVINLLEAEELDTNSVKLIPKGFGKGAIDIDGADFIWNDEEAKDPTLKRISLTVKEGELMAVVGQVGSGKSSLLSAVLGEMTKLFGEVTVSGSVAYVAQEAWIQNATLKDNILFGEQLNTTFYNDVIEACALKHDLTVLPGGDRTEIGEKGINLSGGQKQRVALARAVYHNNDVYLLDDPLAAVDAHVSAHLFNKVVGPNGILKDKTRILVTHGLTHLPECDRIIVMHEGRIAESGTYDQLMELDGKLAEMVRTQDGGSSEESFDTESCPEEKAEYPQSPLRKRTYSSTDEYGSETTECEEFKLIEQEKAESGAIKLDVVKTYLEACGWHNFLGMFCGLLFYVTGLILWNIWLSRWSDDWLLEHPHDYSTMRICGLSLFTLYIMVGVGIAVTFVYRGCLRASKIIHKQMLHSVLRCPLSFFETTPLGRIINRFSMDVEVVDESLSELMAFMSLHFMFVISSLVLMIYTTPMIIFVFIVIFFLFYIFAQFTIITIRHLMRMKAVLRSPVNNLFEESLAGATSIRAFNAQDRFIHKMNRLVDNNQMAFYPLKLSFRWLSWILNSVGSLAHMCAAIFAVMHSDQLTAGLAGMAVTAAFEAIHIFDDAFEEYCRAEMAFVAVERIKNYLFLPPEAPWELPDSDPPESWPNSGDVEFSNYSTRYRPGLDLVLKDVSFKIKSGEKIGVVGRTGAGKSSVALSLFRIIEAASGQIIIDGRDVADMGLHCLRSRVTLIPQDPILCGETIRENVDPHDLKEEKEIWRALKQANLKDFVKEQEELLDHDVTESPLSLGQRQLVCLARALLRKSKILVLDEATASIDVQTDDIIQTTIRTAFKDCTVITIAHRINTILDYDRILVMSGGRVVEFDSPDRLLKDPSSTFYKLASQAGVINGNGGANGKKKQ